MIKNGSKIWIWFAAAILFAAFEVLLIMFIDRPLSEYLRAVDAQHPAIINIFRAYTDLGLGKWYEWPSGIATILCLGLFYWQGFPAKQRGKLRKVGQEFGFIFACVALSGLVTDALKPLIGRARPVVLDRHGFYGFDPLSFRPAQDAYNAFPSGHATTAFALTFALIALWPRGRPWLLAFAIAIAVSRVMVNAHYLADIFAGALVGTLTAVLLQKLFVQQGWIPRKV